MSGFPNRPTRGDFGPVLRDERPLSDPRRMVGADALNLLYWQAAGCSSTAPLVVLEVNVTTGMSTGALAAWDDAQFAYQPYGGTVESVEISDWPWVAAYSALGSNVIQIDFVDNIPMRGGGGTYPLNFQYVQCSPNIPTAGLTVPWEGLAAVTVGPGGVQTNRVIAGVQSDGLFVANQRITLAIW